MTKESISRTREFRAKMLLSVTDAINFIYLLLIPVKEPIKIYS